MTANQKSFRNLPPGDSGLVAIAEIRGRSIGGMLSGGCGKTESFDMTYATSFRWLLERIKFSNVHFNVVPYASRH